MDIDMIRDNIECEQLLGENFSDSIVRAEYVIPDTHPDVMRILTVNSKPHITKTLANKDKVYIEGEINYNIIYLAEDEDNVNVYNVSYTDKFSNYVDVYGADNDMNCQGDVYIEHMECNIINERKIALEGVIKLKAEVYKNYNFEIIKDINNSDGIQMLKNPMQIDKNIGNVDTELIGKWNIEIPANEPEIQEILQCDISIHNREVNILDGSLSVGISARADILYKGLDTRDVFRITNDIDISKDIDFEDANMNMDSSFDFTVDGTEINVSADDDGENRIINIEALIKAIIKLISKEDLDIIDDVYSPDMFLDIKKEDFDLNITYGHSSNEVMAKGDLEVDKNMPKPKEIVMCCGDVCVTDKRIVEDKVIVEGILNVSVLYKTSDSYNYLCSISEEIPFTCGVEMPGCKIQMKCIAKACLENIEADIQAGNISVKGLIKIYTKVNYSTHREFLVEVDAVEDELPTKKASVTIYVVEDGDTLWKIAKRYFTTVDNILEVNEVENPDNIKAGDKLIIPGRMCI